MSNLGGMGEHTFGHLCDEVDLVANPVQRDKTGWDYLVELRRGIDRTDFILPPELQPPLLSCRIQVKTTRAGRGFTDDVTLENWRRFATGELPAFFAVFEYDGRIPTSAYLVHVGPELIKRVQQRVRKEISSGTSDFNHKRMRLSWTAGDRLEEVSGQALRKRLIETIGDPLAYFKNKVQWNSDAGQLVTTFSATTDSALLIGSGERGDPIDALIDLALGLRKDIPIRITEMKTTRHGVELAHQATNIRETRISISSGPPREDVQVSFASRSGSVRAVFSWQMLSPARVFPFIPQDRLRVRYLGEGIDCVHHVNTGRLDFNFRFGLFDEMRSVDSWWQLLKLFQIIDEAADNGAVMEVIFDSRQGFEAEFNCLPLEEGLRRDIKRAHFSIEAAVQVLEGFHTPLSELVRVGELEAVQDRLRIVRGLLRAKEVGLKFAITVDVDGEPPKQLATPMVAHAPIGDAVYIIGASLGGDIEVVSGHTQGEAVRLEWPCPTVKVLVRKRRSIGLAKKLGLSEIREVVIKDLESWPCDYVLAADEEKN